MTSYQEEPQHEQNQDHPDDAHDRVRQRGIYLLPNLFTTAALFAGFYAIVAAMKGQYETAAIAIFVALVADGLDGRIARLTNTQTPFGAQYDSLSDLAAFGIAPSLVLYSWSLYSLGKVGWVAAFVYTGATALRLARFNTQVSDKHFFQGLPCPTAAGMVASIVWLGTIYDISGVSLSLLMAIIAMGLALLMVSSIRYSSFKNIDFRGKVSFFAIVFMVFMLAAIAMEPPEVFFIIALTYVLSGPILTIVRIRKRRQQRGNPEQS